MMCVEEHELPADARRAGGHGTSSRAPRSQRARIEAAFAELKGMATRAKLSERQRDVWLLYQFGFSDAEIGKALGLGPQAVTDTARAAKKHMAHAFPLPESLLPWVSRADLLRVMKGRAESEPDPEQHPAGPGEVVSIHSRPFGTCPADLAEPEPGSRGDVSLYAHRLLCRLVQMTLPERALARVEEVPAPVKPAMVDAERKRRALARAERRARRKRGQKADS